MLSGSSSGTGVAPEGPGVTTGPEVRGGVAGAGVLYSSSGIE